MLELINFLPEAGQTVKFDYLSIAYIVIVVLGLIIGIFKGFLNSVLSLVVFVGAILIAYFVSRPLADWLGSMPLQDSIYQGIYGWLSPGNEEAFATVVTNENKDVILPQVMESLNIPEVLASKIVSVLEANIPQEGIELGLLICSTITYYVLIVIAFVIAWIIALIVLTIIKKILKKILTFSIFKVVDRLIGGVAGLAIGVCICLLISYGITFASSMNEGMYAFFNELLYLEDDSVYTIAKMLYQNNILLSIF